MFDGIYKHNHYIMINHYLQSFNHYEPCFNQIYIYIYNLCLLITGIITLPRRFFSVSQEALGHSCSTLQLDGSDRLWYGQGQGQL